MSGREAAASRIFAKPQSADNLEVVPGSARENLQGWVPELANPEELRAALEQAFDYRGDVLITRKDGSQVEGYIFDRKPGRTLEDSCVRLLPKDSAQKIAVAFSDIAGLAFTGRDMAAGKNWESWVKQYWERKSAGEANIGLHPEALE